jgi:hypothetical protein
MPIGKDKRQEAEQFWARCARLYTCGLSVNQIAERFSCSPSRVRQALIRMNVELRNRSESVRQAFINTL